MSQPIGTFVIVLNLDKTKVLMGKRKNAFAAGAYGCPGGRVEVGEDVGQSVMRELTEETSLIAKKIKFLGTIKENQGEKDFIHFVFLCDEYEGNPICAEPEKCEEWSFFPIEDLPEPVVNGHLVGIAEFYLKNRSGLLSI